MGINSRKPMDPRWVDTGASVMEGFENCIIQILDMNSEDDRDTFDPYAKTGAQSAPSAVLWEGPAQMQVYRQTLNADDVAGGLTHLRSIRFTTSKRGIVFPVRKGLIVHIISCPNDPILETYEYVVTSGLNGAVAWRRTIECESDMIARVGV